MAARVGTKFVCKAQAGLAEDLKEPAPTLGDEPEFAHKGMSSEMVHLDMSPGTVVEVIGYDTDRDLVLVEWSDDDGNPRLTTVEQATLDSLFARKGK